MLRHFGISRMTREPLLRSTTSRKACRGFLVRRVSEPHKLRGASERATERCSDDSSSRALQIGFTFRASCHYVFFRITSSTTTFFIWKITKKSRFSKFLQKSRTSNCSILSANRARIRCVLDHSEEKTQKFDTMSSNEPPQVGHFP